MFENISEKNVYIGCGEDKKEGFIHSNSQKFDHIDIICNPWELSQHIKDVNHIYSKNLLPYLTNFEADRTLRDWFKALKTNGSITIIVPDINFYATQWLEAEWNEENLKDKNSIAQQSFRHIWGTQENCDPWLSSYDSSYSTVIKSGYNQKRLQFLLERIGALHIEIHTFNGVLTATATKPLGGGERQDATKLEDVRMDHRKRYEFASQCITKENAIVTDGACGVAYGSYILAQNPNVKEVQAIDISKEAIDHGKEYFSNDKISYFLSNLEDAPIPTQSPDYFISFETIEHLPSPEKYIEKIAQNIKDDGVFIGSTPNETIMPYTKYFSYHTRHFTVDDLQKILTKYGFNDIQFYQQKREEPSEIERIEDGQYIIFVAKKNN